MNRFGRSQLIKQLARQVGFDAAGITTADPLDVGGRYRRWLEAGMAGSMQYLHRNVEKRLNPALLMPEAKTIICVGVNYFNMPDGPIRDRAGRIAMYAWGRDYHVVLKDMLRQLAAAIREALGRQFRWRTAVDSAPVKETALAQRAGLGWIGKHSCLVSEDFGPFLVLGELFTDLDLAADEPAEKRCGRCDRCVKACPTGAISEDGIVDARKCISYLTIEHRDDIPLELRAKMGRWIFGCDVCIQACPFARKAQPSQRQAFKRFVLGPGIDVLEVLAWDQRAWRRRCADSAGLRADLNMWRRNAIIVAENLIAGGNVALPDRLRSVIAGPDRLPE